MTKLPLTPRRLWVRISKKLKWIAYSLKEFPRDVWLTVRGLGVRDKANVAILAEGAAGRSGIARGITAS